MIDPYAIPEKSEASRGFLGPIEREWLDAYRMDIGESTLTGWTDPARVSMSGATLSGWQAFKVRYGHWIWWGGLLAAAALIFYIGRK